MSVAVLHAGLMTFAIYMFKENNNPIMLAMALVNAGLLGFTLAFALVEYLIQKQKEKDNG